MITDSTAVADIRFTPPWRKRATKALGSILLGSANLSTEAGSSLALQHLVANVCFIQKLSIKSRFDMK